MPLACIATGTYVGDGAISKAITGLGFAPKYVRIDKRETVNGTEVKSFSTTDKIIDDNGSGGAIFDDNDEHEFQTNRIIALGADGFTVDDNGADEDPNANGITYNYLALGQA